MIFEVAIGDRIRTVGVVRKGALLHVELDGRTHIVDARRVNGDVISMLVQLADASSPSRSIDAAFSARPGADDLDVYLDLIEQLVDEGEHDAAEIAAAAAKLATMARKR